MAERPEPHPVLSWTIIIGIAVGTMLWGIISYHWIKQGVRTWEFGQFQDTPAASIYSTAQPQQKAEVPAQIQLVPATQEAKP